MESIPRIVNVEPRGPAELVVQFDNGIQKIYDCRPLLARPQFSLLRTPAFFCAVRVDPGGYGISWNEDIDLSEYEVWVRGTPLVEPAKHAQSLQR